VWSSIYVHGCRAYGVCRPLAQINCVILRPVQLGHCALIVMLWDQGCRLAFSTVCEINQNGYFSKLGFDSFTLLGVLWFGNTNYFGSFALLRNTG